MVPEITSSPTFFSTGMLSPVIDDWFILVLPSITTPSTGIDVPGFITIISLTKISSVGITSSFPPLITIEVFGAKFINFVIASPVFPLDFASKNFPTVISVNIVPAELKYKLLIDLLTKFKSLYPNP